MKHCLIPGLTIIMLLIAVPAFAGIPTTMGDYVWYDENCDGLQNEGPENGLNDIQVMFFRDYDCNGEIDGSDEIYDYAFTKDDADGNPGYYSISAYSGWCFVTFLATEYVPEGLHATTAERVDFVLLDTGFSDADFGLGDCPSGPPEYSCPKTMSFWRNELNRGAGTKFTQAEINMIVAYALTQTRIFTSYTDMKNALNSSGCWGSKTRAKNQLAALLLNLAAYSKHTSLAYDIGLAEAEPLYLWWIISANTVGAAADQFESWYLSYKNYWMIGDLSDMINDGFGIWVTCAEWWECWW